MQIKSIHNIKLLIQVGFDKPSPAMASALSPKKVKLPQFIAAVHAQTKHLKKDTPVPIIVDIDSKGAFHLTVKSPATSYLLKDAAGIKTGIAQAGKLANVGAITEAQLTEIAKIKLPDLNTDDLEKVKRIISGSAASLGISINK